MNKRTRMMSALGAAGAGGANISKVGTKQVPMDGGTQSKMPYQLKRGGRCKKAAGGVGKLRHDQT